VVEPSPVVLLELPSLVVDDVEPSLVVLEELPSLVVLDVEPSPVVLEDVWQFPVVQAILATYTGLLLVL